MLRKLPLLLLFCFIASTATAQLNVQWVARYTTAGNNIDRARAMTLDANGNSVITGTSWNGSNFDIVTTKFDASGNLVWTASYNGAGNDFDEARAITTDTAGNIIVAGTSAATPTNYNIAVIKYDPAGNLLWDTIYNGPGNNYDEPNDIITDSTGTIYITGSSDGAGSGADIVTIAYSPAGAQLWATRYTGGGANIDAGKGIALDTAGNVYITGTTRTSSANNQDVITIKYNAAGVQQWFIRFNGPGSVYDEGSDIAVNDTGGIFVCGYVRALVGVTNYDYITLAYSASGALLWQQSINGAGNENDRANSIAITPFGKIAVTGRTLGTGATAEDCTTILYDAATGAQQWIKTFDGAAVNYDEGRKIISDSLGNIFVTGYAFTTAQSNNYLLLQYDSTGNELLRERWNGSGNNSDQAYSIGIDTLGSIYLGGMSRGAGTGEDFAVVKFCRLEANAGTDTTVCQGASVQLNASSSFGGIDSVWWVPASGLSNPNIANPIATPTANTCYVAYIRNIHGCINADTVCITLTPFSLPEITANGPLSFCIGNQVTLTAQDTTGSTVNYNWSTGDTTQSITVDTSGTYTVTVISTLNCTSQNQLTVTVNPLPVVSAGNDVSFCSSTNVTLCATGAANYNWAPAFGLSDSTIACPVAGPTQTTTYIVTGTDTNGCADTDTVSVTLFPFAGVPVITQNVSVLTSSAASTYQWYFNNTLIP
ncbi:MAG: SBBP repeat-containing protein, partial [Bacteroidia bacterium]